ncbi:MAG: hypothetical protein K8L99_31125 [Anaerolineae bacterium]|nr:hypothetical protein [Anaerolineae bacterium]
MNILLSKIQRGMAVYDQTQNQIGMVDYVQLGDEDPLRPTRRASHAYGTDQNQSEWLLESERDVFAPDEVPDLLRERLLLYGFIRLDAPGISNADRYIFPNQIQSVEGNRVTLRVSREELLQRP